MKRSVGGTSGRIIYSTVRKVERLLRDCSIPGLMYDSKLGHRGGPWYKLMEEKREGERREGERKLSLTISFLR